MTNLSEKEITKLIEQIDEMEARFRKVMKPGKLVQITKGDWILTRTKKVAIPSLEEQEKIRKEKEEARRLSWDVFGDVKGEEKKGIWLLFLRRTSSSFLGLSCLLGQTLLANKRPRQLWRTQRNDKDIGC